MNGNMFMGLFGSAVGIKLPDEEREKLLARARLGPVRSGRPTHGWLRHPPGWLDRQKGGAVDRQGSHARCVASTEGSEEAQIRPVKK